MTPLTPKKKREQERQEQERAARALLQARFLDAFRQGANVWAACKQVGVSRQTVYGWRDTDPAFRAAWDDAENDAVDTLEVSAWQRARNGVKREKGVYYEGKLIATDVTTEYSDTLLIFLLKAHRPAKYRETTRHELTGADGGPVQVITAEASTAALRAAQAEIAQWQAERPTDE